MADITSYKVAVPDRDIEKLKHRLEHSTFPDELEGAGWDLGTPLADVKRLASYWKDGFDWRKAEAKINELPQFKTPIEVDGFGSLRIHFVHGKSEVQGAIPLLFVHGWPGNFLEVKKILQLLTSGNGKDVPSFHVVAPSLPNYGFSDGVKKRGFGLVQYAETCHKLMLKLGYNEYVTQGGDWGFMITRVLGLQYPQHVKGSHVNMIRGLKPTFTRNPILALQHLFTPYSERDIKGFERSEWFKKEGAGYNLLQATKPQTIGYALADSPVGLLAWIYEKLRDWTDNYPWTDDEILTWISIYQFSTAGPAANLRIYYEATHTDDEGIHRLRTHDYVPNVKLGVAHFPKELTVIPHTWAGTMGPLVYQSQHEHGGHFAATEHPEVIVEDLQKMFGRKGGAYGVVKGRDGYAKESPRL